MLHWRSWFALALVALAAACEREPGPERPPDVILISIDTLRADALRAFDPAAAPLPALDRFAGECVRFGNALSSASWTLPAHASLLTGLYPDRHGATDRRVQLARDVPTLAGVLAQRGYQTVALTGGGFLDAKYGLGRGFERYESQRHEKQDPAEPAEHLLGRVRSFLAQRDDERPLFLFLHSYAVHNYYDARPEAAARTGRPGLRTRKEYVDCELGRAACPEPAWEDLRALYRAELEILDGVFAELRSELEHAGLWDSAVIVFLSDHGEGFDPERARIHHGGRLHADQLRVPLFVRVPGVATRDESALVSLVDVMPTVLDLAGAIRPADLDGQSLAPCLGRGGIFNLRQHFAMEHYFDWDDGKRMSAEEVRDLPLALAVVNGKDWFLTGTQGDELYSLEADPEQRSNLAASSPEKVALLRATLEKRRRPRPATEPAVEDEALSSELDALGYGGGR